MGSRYCYTDTLTQTHTVSAIEIIIAGQLGQCHSEFSLLWNIRLDFFDMMIDMSIIKIDLI